MTISLQHSTRRSAFTMIEIAISLAIVGFAMVAIIGILPVGMRTQKENREETIINQDASLFLDAIRSGARGYDDLTNYVMGITNASTFWDVNLQPGPTQVEWFTRTDSSVNPEFLLTNGFRIVGLLSTPKYVPMFQGQPPKYTGFVSNYTFAGVRSLSGPASEKVPQNNADVQQLSLAYRLISDVTPYGTNHYDFDWTNYLDTALYQPGTNLLQITSRSNYLKVAQNLEANLHDLRLTFRWPMIPGGLGRGRQVFRTMVSGNLLRTNDSGGWPLYFFEPRNYVRAP
jgi:type II secretory pathway pseudopilin PulG